MKNIILILLVGSLFADETQTAGVINITKKSALPPQTGPVLELVL